MELPRGTRMAVVATMTAAIAASACTGSAPESERLPSVALSLRAALPSSATVTAYHGKGKWGDVIAIRDSYENMASGPTRGATLTKAQYWLVTNLDAIRDAGIDYVLFCNSAVNTDPETGEVTRRLSEMVPVERGGSTEPVETSQSSDEGRSSTIPCEP